MENLTVSYAEVVVRLLATAVLCGLIGLERETRDQSAGFRTHILLGLGAALFTLVSAYGFAEFTRAALESGGRGVQFDPTRIAAQVVTGVGFLGAGAIIRRGVDVRGLTTAASLWAAAAIGLASGAGFYFGAAATTAVVLIALYTLRGVRVYVVSRFRNSFAVLGVHFGGAGAEISRVVEIVEGRDVRIRSTDAVIEDGRASYEIQLRIPPGRSVQEMLGEISALPSVRLVEMRANSARNSAPYGCSENWQKPKNSPTPAGPSNMRLGERLCGPRCYR